MIKIKRIRMEMEVWHWLALNEEKYIDILND